jgi:molybdopterin converting factor small subunit
MEEYRNAAETPPDAEVAIRLYATLSPKTPESADAFPITKGETVRDILKRLSIPETDAKLVFVNAKKSPMTTVLSGGERIGIFPPIGGG